MQCPPRRNYRRQRRRNRDSGKCQGRRRNTPVATAGCAAADAAAHVNNAPTTKLRIPAPIKSSAQSNQTSGCEQRQPYNVYVMSHSSLIGRLTSAFVCCALLPLLWVGDSHAQNGDRRGFLWEVRKGNQIAWLFGTIHVGRPEFYPLPPSRLGR